MPRWTEVPLVDGSYSDDARPWSVQECINYIPVAAEQATTMSSAILRQLPGATLYTHLMVGGVDAGPIRGMHNVEGQLFVVAGTTLFELRTTGAVFNRGTIPGTERTRMAHNQITNGFQLAIPTGSSGYVWDTTTSTLTHITDDGFTGAITFDFIDNYITYVDSARNFAGTSELADALSYNTLDRYDPEASPDKIVGQIVSHQQWWLMSTRTIEPYDDTGQNTGTFQRAQGMVIDQGLASPWAVVNLDNTVIWLGSNGFVYRANGYTPVRVSTHAIEQAIARCNISRAFAFTWEDRGHSVFYLTFPDGFTLGYDCGSGKWHRRVSDSLNRWRMNDLVAWNGGYYGGDFASGKIYFIDWNASDEDGQVMERRRTTGVLYDAKNPVIVKALELVFDTGQPQPTFPITIMGNLPNGRVGDSESIRYVASGGFGALTYSYTGTLPPGITLDANGLASGIYTTVGTYNFTVIATDSIGGQASIPQTVTVAAISLSGALGNGRSGFASSVQYAHLGGIEPVTFSIQSGTVPPALTFTTSGLLSGTRSTAATYSWTVLATDAIGNTATLPDTSVTGPPWAWSFVAQTALPANINSFVAPVNDPVTGLMMMAGKSGDVFISSDGGHTWAHKTGIFGGGVIVTGVGIAAGALVAYTAGSGWKRSTDGGTTWSPILIGGVAAPAVHFAMCSPNVLWAGDSPNTSKYSSDGGVTWVDSTTIPASFLPGDSLFPFGGLYIPSWNTWVIPGQNVIYESNGITPTSISTALTGLTRVGVAVYSPTLDIVMVAGQGSVYWRAKTGAWQTVTTGLSMFGGACWVPLLQLFIAGNGGVNIFTSPDAVTWTTQTSTLTGSVANMVWSTTANEIFVAPGLSNIPFLSDI